MTANKTGNQTFPDRGICAACGEEIAQPYGYCSLCDACYCERCAAEHFCAPECQANGCHAGLCVREVRGGVLSPLWIHPPGYRGPDSGKPDRRNNVQQEIAPKRDPLLHPSPSTRSEQ